MNSCDHRSVGVVITDHRQRILLLERARAPKGKAPVAGHVDEHGTARQAAEAETREEAGLQLDELTELVAGRLPNICRRPATHPRHDGHDWTIFGARAGGEPSFSAEETRGGGWYTAAQLQDLADQTIAAIAEGGEVGLEPVWVHWLAELGYLRVSPAGLRQVWNHFSQPPA
jgi:ADP-ribose pyrophosphatase YjhB (NUDIX family)